MAYVSFVKKKKIKKIPLKSSSERLTLQLAYFACGTDALQHCRVKGPEPEVLQSQCTDLVREPGLAQKELTDALHSTPLLSSQYVWKSEAKNPQKTNPKIAPSFNSLHRRAPPSPPTPTPGLVIWMRQDEVFLHLIFLHFSSSSSTHRGRL